MNSELITEGLKDLAFNKSVGQHSVIPFKIKKNCIKCKLSAFHMCQCLQKPGTGGTRFSVNRIILKKKILKCKPFSTFVYYFIA